MIPRFILKIHYYVGSNINKMSQYIISNRIINIIKTEFKNKIYANRYIHLLEHSINNSEGKIIEYHHMLPKAIYPDFINDPDNLIPLPLKYHFLAHWMLALATEENKMWQALRFMNGLGKYGVLSSKRYELLRSSYVNNMSTREDGSSFSRDRVLNGTHNWLNISTWEHFLATEESSNSWRVANDILNIIDNNTNIGYRRVFKVLTDKYNLKFSYTAIKCIMYKIYENWTPNEDTDYLEWLSKFEPFVVIDNTYPFLGVRHWQSRNATEEAINTWIVAERAYDIILVNPKIKYPTLFYTLTNEYNKKFSSKTVARIINTINKGWVPKKDMVFQNFKSEYMKK
jgi:hypothetical protein